MIKWYQSLPRNIKMVGTSVLGASIGWLTYEFIYFLMPLHPRATLSWILAYLIGIARQHGLHRYLTFSDQSTPYWPSLGRAYVMYLSSFCIGAILQFFLTEKFGINHRVAWVVCLFLTASISFVFLKKFVFKKEDSNLS